MGFAPAADVAGKRERFGERLLQLNFCVFARCDDDELSAALRKKSKFSDTFARAHASRS